MSKPKLFLDFDNTIVNSDKVYCSLYNWLYSTNKDFRYADWTKVRERSYADQCPLAVNDVKEMFEMAEFFMNLEFFPQAKETIEKLNEDYEIIIVSIGTPKNLSLKSLWLEENLPFVNKYILLNNGENLIDKSIVDMEGAIFIDDVASNLTSSNADVKLCFGGKADKNRDWNGLWKKEWIEVKKLLLD